MAHDRGIILDMDGTLIDSNDAHARAWVDAALAHGHELSFDEIRPLIGMGGDRILARLFDLDQDSAEAEELTATRSDIFRSRYLPELQPFPGVRRLLERLRDDGFDRVVASSSSESDLAPLMERAGVADLVRSSTSASDADESKPAPDIVESAISRANAPRERLVMIGDTPYDVEAARRARLPIIAVRSGGWGEAELEGAALVYDDVADLLDHYVEAFLDAPYL